LVQGGGGVAGGVQGGDGLVEVVTHAGQLAAGVEQAALQLGEFGPAEADAEVG
jgi:hypothetical protein